MRDSHPAITLGFAVVVFCVGALAVWALGMEANPGLLAGPLTFIIARAKGWC